MCVREREREREGEREDPKLSFESHNVYITKGNFTFFLPYLLLSHTMCSNEIF